MSYTFRQVLPADRALLAAVDALLHQEGIRRDAHLDYTCALLDEEGCAAATGSCFQNTLRCFAVDSAHQGEGLMNQLLTHLIQVQVERGNLHLFIYTKCETAKFFRDVGFYPVAEVPGRISFLENRRTGFSRYLEGLQQESPCGKREGGAVGAVVMNANPFTLGHRYLVEQAAAQCDVLHLFVVSEDASLVPFDVRWKLVQAGTADLGSVILHRTGPYLISSATFPSYFLKEEALVSRGHAELDAAVFGRIGSALGITRRFLGEEPFSQVTALYNQVLAERLPQFGIQCAVLPRKEVDGIPISASTVRQCIHDGDWKALEAMLPSTTLDFLRWDEAAEIIRAIQSSDTLIHH